MDHRPTMDRQTTRDHVRWHRRDIKSARQIWICPHGKSREASISVKRTHRAFIHFRILRQSPIAWRNLALTHFGKRAKSIMEMRQNRICSYSVSVLFRRELPIGIGVSRIRRIQATILFSSEGRRPSCFVSSICLRGEQTSLVMKGHGETSFEFKNEPKITFGSSFSEDFYLIQYVLELKLHPQKFWLVPF